jgi:DNA-binding GntR family transcriptional regulator
MADLAGVQTLAMCVRQFNWVLKRLQVAGQRTPPVSNSPSHHAHVRFVELLEHASPAAVEEFWRRHCDAIGEFILKGREGERVVDLFT